MLDSKQEAQLKAAKHLSTIAVSLDASKWEIITAFITALDLGPEKIDQVTEQLIATCDRLSGGLETRYRHPGRHR